MKTKLLTLTLLLQAVVALANPERPCDCDTPAPTVLDDAPIMCGASTVGDLQAEGEIIQWYYNETGGSPLAPGTVLTDTVYYASQTLNGCESETRMAVYVTINSPEPPTGEAVQHFCFTGTVGDLYSDNGMYWYANATGGNPLPANMPLVNLENYFASTVVDGCESSVRLQVEVILHTPQVDELQDVTNCAGFTLPPLENGNYFTESNGTGNSLSPGTLITETTIIYIYNYYDTPPGCGNESSFTVTVPQLAAPAGAQQQTIEVANGQEATIADITAGAEGNITWHLTEEEALWGENALPETTVLTDGTTYYGIQTIGNCRSASVLAVTVDVVMGSNSFNKGSFQCYPNPVSDILFFEYSGIVDAVEVFSMPGQKVLTLQPGLNTGQLDMSQLTPGLYLVKFFSSGASTVLSIMKE
jgi:large repetitive protein